MDSIIRPHSGEPRQSPVIVTDGLWRKSLSAIRSLGKAGYPVHVMGNSLFTTGFWSSFTVGRVCAPTAADDPEAFGKALMEYLQKFSGGPLPILLPMEDATLQWVSANREKLACLARFSIPSQKALAIAADKSLTLEKAESLGLPVPLTLRPQTAEQINDSIGKMQGDAWVVKPRNGAGSAGIVYGGTRAVGELTEAFWRAHWLRYGELIVQERISSMGRGLGASFLMSQGRSLAYFSHERLQQYPVSGGPSTDRRSIYSPDIEKWSQQLLASMEWDGVAMVEWKSDPVHGGFKLMEINPRFWGSLELAVRSGVNFPVLYADFCRGALTPLPAPIYRENIRCRWMVPGDILRYVSTPRKDRESIARFLTGLPGLAEEWDIRDLRGAVATFICTALLALNPKYWRFLRRG